jgi:hypothetical protein
MDSKDFPGNSKSPRSAPSEPKNVQAVVTNEAVAKKKSLGKRAREIFVGGDSKTVIQYMISEILVPQAKDMIVEAVQQGFERMIFGESRSRHRTGSRPAGPNNYTNYNRYSGRGNNPIGRSERADRPPAASTRSNVLDDIVVQTRVEADAVLDQMFEIVNEYGSVSVADLYTSLDWSSNSIDHKWGWTSLAGSDIRRVHDGYLLMFPKPVSLDER